MKRIIVWAALIIAIGAACAYYWPARAHSTAKTAAAVWNCAQGQAPCIELLDAKGVEIARFNDFRFKPNHCITFDAYPKNVWQNYCGSYTLKWIGPANQNPASQQG